MDSSIKVSVIVPVYNTEKYLATCLNSIVLQTLKDIEIICINDGSTDHSLDVLYQFQKKDPRIQIISQQNSYPGIARNNGMRFAKGEYIAFWDSDDFFEPTALEKLYNEACKCHADICVCGGRSFFEDTAQFFSFESLLNSKLITVEMPFNMRTMPNTILNFTNVAVWNKLFRREFINNNHVHFSSVQRGEDILFTEVALCAATSITIVDEELVNYRAFREDSLTITNDQSALEIVKQWLRTAEELKKRSCYPMQSFANRALKSCLALLRTIQCSWDTFVQVFNSLKFDAFPQMDISLNTPDYYYSVWQYKLLQSLYQDSPEVFLLKYIHVLDIRITNKTTIIAHEREKSRGAIGKLKRKKKKLEHEIILQNNAIVEQKQQIESQMLSIEALQYKHDILRKELLAIKTSKSYIIGRSITFLPRIIRSKINRLFHRI